MKLFTFSLLLALFITSCSKDDEGCNCKATMYKNAWTDEVKNFGSQPMNCETNTHIEPVIDDKWYFVECKNNPSY